MFATLGKIFGTEKALSGIVDGVKDGLDALVYTDEEKAQDAAKERAAARGMIVEWMSATKGQNLARRLIALMVTVVWLGQYLVAWVLDMVAIFVEPDMGKQLNAAAHLTGERADSMTGAMMLILGFYFAAPHMGQIAVAAVERFGGKKQREDRTG